MEIPISIDTVCIVLQSSGHLYTLFQLLFILPKLSRMRKYCYDYIGTYRYASDMFVFIGLYTMNDMKWKLWCAGCVIIRKIMGDVHQLFCSVLPDPHENFIT